MIALRLKVAFQPFGLSNAYLVNNYRVAAARFASVKVCPTNQLPLCSTWYGAHKELGPSFGLQGFEAAPKAENSLVYDTGSYRSSTHHSSYVAGGNEVPPEIEGFVIRLGEGLVEAATTFVLEGLQPEKFLTF